MTVWNDAVGGKLTNELNKMVSDVDAFLRDTESELSDIEFAYKNCCPPGNYSDISCRDKIDKNDVTKNLSDSRLMSIRENLRGAGGAVETAVNDLLGALR